MDLSVTTESIGETFIVHIAGDLDVYTAPQLKDSLLQAILGRGPLVLDLSDVHFIDSTALSVLADALRRTQAADRDLRLVMDDPYLLKIFRITGFDGLFTIFPGVSEAVSVG